MRQTLFRIPLDEPIFGFGILLALWTALGLWRAWRHWGQSNAKLTGEHATSFLTWLAIAVAIVVLPQFEARLAPQGIPLFGYGFMLFIGFLGAAWYATWRAKQEGIPADAIADLGLWGFGAGIIRARIFYLVEYHDRVFAGREGLGLLLAAVNLPDGGLVFYGGLMLGVAFFFAFCAYRKLPPLKLADIALPAVFIGLGFGRLGCLLNGCCFGGECHLPWAITFDRDSVPFRALVNDGLLSPEAAATMPLHPTQIYSSIDAFLLAFLLAAYFKYRRRDGEVLAVGWLLYPITRFLIEFLRSDEPGQFGTSLTIGQWVSMGLFAFALVYTAWLSRRPTQYQPEMAETTAAPRRAASASV